MHTICIHNIKLNDDDDRRKIMKGKKVILWFVENFFFRKIFSLKLNYKLVQL